ncbi:MAG: phage holin family protein [Anaerolineae bacterium]|nr:phage holin family protein [Anaerolineae bacterium]
MAYVLLRLLVNALAIGIVARLLPGFHVTNNDLGTFILIGIVFGIVNALIKPIIALLTCSLVVFTLGLFVLVINGLMLWITAALLPELLQIDNFWWAILGGIIVSVINMVMEIALGQNNIEVRRIE